MGDATKAIYGMRKRLTQDDVNRYVEEGGAECPYCGDDGGIEGSSVDIEQGQAYQEITCVSCGAYWTDCYRLERIIPGVDQGQDDVTFEDATVAQAIRPLAWLLETILDVWHEHKIVGGMEYHDGRALLAKLREEGFIGQNLSEKDGEGAT